VLLSLSAALAAMAMMLTLPVALHALRSWARRLHQSRRSTVEEHLPESFLFVDSRRYAAGLVAAVVVMTLLVALVSGSGLLGSAAGAATLLVPAAVAGRLRKRRRSRFLHQLPDALDLLAASLRSGLGLLPALQYLVAHQQPPLAQEFGLLIRKQRLGSTLEEALEEMRQTIGGGEVALFVTAVTVARQLGGNLSEILTRLGQTLREKQAIEDKISSLTAQGRLQARIVGLLPVALMVVMLRLEPQAMRLMYTTARGWATLLVLGVLEIVGVLVLRRVVRVDV
jgi:tight adherence protein B